MNLSILQHYNGHNINQNTLLFLTYLSQKNSLRAVRVSAEWPETYNNSSENEKSFQKSEHKQPLASQTWDYAKKGG